MLSVEYLQDAILRYPRFFHL